MDTIQFMLTKYLQLLHNREKFLRKIFCRGVGVNGYEANIKENGSDSDGSEW